MKKYLLFILTVLFISMLVSCENDNPAAENIDAFVRVEEGFTVLPGTKEADIQNDADPDNNEESEKADALEDADAEQKEEISAVEKYVSSMDSAALAGQLVFCACPVNDAEIFIQDYQPGGIILFGNNIDGETRESLSEKLSQYQEKSPIPLLIGTDEEGGSVARVSGRESFRKQRFSSPRKLINAGGAEALAEEMQEKTILLTDLGINVNLAPVCDLASLESSFMYSRALPGSVDEVCVYISEMVAVMENGKLATVLKHFPGYGENGDTHTAEVIDEREKESFDNDIKPFQAGINAGSCAVLVSHNIVKAYDDENPASLSKPIIDLLRDKLGSDVVAMTDDLDMAAISSRCSIEEAVVRAVEAGEDLVICGDGKRAIETLTDAINNGSISRERAEESVRRIINWKVKLGLIDIENIY